MKKAVYIESSVVSYLAALPSRDVITAARQAITWEWWEGSRKYFDLFISLLVRNEISQGDTSAVQRRLEIIASMTVLGTPQEAESIAHELVASSALPQVAQEDALHIGIAAAQGVDYLLTWNFRHINNARQNVAIIKTVEQFGFSCPTICSRRNSESNHERRPCH